MDQLQVERLAEHVFGTAPETVERMTFGHSNVVYEATVRGQAYIIRTNADAAVLQATARNLDILADLGLPVPITVTLDLSKRLFPSAYIVLHHIPGRDLRYELPGMTKPQMTAVAEQIVSFQQKAGQLPEGTGYGWVPIGAQGPYRSWYDVVARDIDNHIHHLRYDVAERQLQAIHSRLEARKPYLAQVPPRCFLDDLTIKNVIVRDGRLQGVIDFDWVCYGDPLYMISLTQTGIIADIGWTDALFYVEELCRISGIDGRQREIVDFYSVVHGLQFLGFLRGEHQESSAARVVRYIRQWLEAVELPPINEKR
ncbi:phosphotransferase family protein [Paenibacillus piri]|uniref:Aminoglycoside phosphotransferase family protein n=1 Tax=Paenibacillus piri TaxID=2547395 RepID=A0A4R5L031_9BACL|nr:aminoglycoside phosphotransferase family protein [Paenibacillus piri]TDG00691.1 aminoglycoside phosphotransferase family protein [Paenibacillus piri]